jgi:AcrR family transcriptional regulator
MGVARDATPSARRRPGRPSQGARDALIAAARELFATRDFDDVSTGEVLARAGVSRGAMYHHFESKTELFRAAYEASEHDLIARLAARVEPAAGGPFEQLVAGCRAYLAECVSSRELQHIGLRQSRAVLGWEGWSKAAAELGIGMMEGGVSAAAEAGELATSNPRVTARLILAALIEAALLISTAANPAARLREVEPEMIRILESLKTR